MQRMTLEQLRATAHAGGVVGVTLKGQGGGFFLEIATRSGQNAVLSKARSAEPRRFGNPTSALVVLRDIGIAVAQIDATHWNPEQKDMSQSRQNRAQAMREAQNRPNSAWKHEANRCGFVAIGSGWVARRPGNESNLYWVTKEINSKKAYAEELTRHQHTIVERQQRLIALQEKVARRWPARLSA